MDLALIQEKLNCVSSEEIMKILHFLISVFENCLISNRFITRFVTNLILCQFVRIIDDVITIALSHIYRREDIDNFSRAKESIDVESGGVFACLA